MAEETPTLDLTIHSEEEALEAFLEWVLERGIELYEAQEEAILEVFGGNHVILATPTGSGKSLVAVAAHYRAMVRSERSVYTSPIKALVSEKFFDLCRSFGAEHVGMLTGDASINRDAPILCCTAEVLANMALREGTDTDVQHAIIDEFHYYGDRDRGMAWQIPLLSLPDTTFLLMSATLGDTTRIEEGLYDLTGRDLSVVRSTQRPVPLEYEYREKALHETIHDLVVKDRAPIYVVSFSQREASEQAQAQMSVDYCSKEQKRAIAAELKGVRFTSPFGKDISRYLRHGIGLHHAGMLPRYRHLVETLAQKGMLKVINGTDTLGVGVNVPIRTVLFTRLFKFDGEKVGILKVRDFQQIAGRAGRKGFDEKGWVACQAPEYVIENQRLAAKAAQSGRKLKKKKPPQRNFVPWNEGTFRKLIEGRPEALESVFRVDHGFVLNMLNNDAGYGGVIDLIAASHQHDGSKRHLRRDGRRVFKSLRAARIIEVENGKAWVSEDLQRDFSLNHTLSLYLYDALDRLDDGRETWPLDVLTLCESILENPRAILLRQLDRAKGDLVNRLKAEGVPYEERMEALEKVTYPRPMKEWIWQTFDRFAEEHPWVSTENIRPKSIARELVERYISFDDYVREYGLQRSEGVLLRYLSQTYKTLLQNVPDVMHTDEIVDIVAFLRALLARVDSSLVREWEAMQGIDHDLPADPFAEARAAAPDADMRGFRARLRAELHALVRALAAEDWDEAAICVRDRGDWTAERLEEALAPFLEEHEKLLWSHQARLSDKTVITEAGHRRWELAQTLLDPSDENLWSIQAVVDLEDREDGEDGPLIELLRIGT